MTVTVNVPEQTIFIAGNPHYLSRAGVNKLFAWLLSTADLKWGWADGGEYVFHVEVNQ